MSKAYDLQDVTRSGECSTPYANQLESLRDSIKQVTLLSPGPFGSQRWEAVLHRCELSHIHLTAMCHYILITAGHLTSSPWLVANYPFLFESHLHETAGRDHQTTAVHVLEQHACHLLMRHASKVTRNRLHFLFACSLQTSKLAGYSGSARCRKRQHQIRGCQINADGRQWEAQKHETAWCQIELLFFSLPYVKYHPKSQWCCCYSTHEVWGESEWHIAG